MEKWNFETNKFKDENELNLFIVAVQDMRNAVKAYRKNPTEAGRKKMILLESQVDDYLKRLPEINALFL